MKNILFLVFVLFLSSCTIYTEKQTEALSRSVYATKDSFDSGRFDLTEEYSNTNTKLVKPPKTRIEIRPIINSNKNRVIMVPSKFRNDSVVVVDSNEYTSLLKDKIIFKQITKDNSSLMNAKKAVEEELVKQAEYKEKMVRDLNVMQKKLLEKDIDLLKCKILIVSLLSVFGVCIYLRIKGIL